jgi:hypothetical protein
MVEDVIGEAAVKGSQMGHVRLVVSSSVPVTLRLSLSALVSEAVLSMVRIQGNLALATSEILSTYPWSFAHDNGFEWSFLAHFQR